MKRTGEICGLGFSLAFIFMVLAPLCASSHEVRPALLELTEIDQPLAERYRTLWKLPRTGGATLRLAPGFPSDCLYTEDPLPRMLPSAFLFLGELECTEGLRGRRVEVLGIQSTLTDALLRVNFVSGKRFDALLRPSAPSTLIPVQDSIGVPAYLRLGVTHMLLGADHLLFVLGLLLLIVPGRRFASSDAKRLGIDQGVLVTLAATVTSFTLAHSITLALAVLGQVNLPQAPVEIVIAMSIVLLACEISRDRARSGMLARHPWQMAFAFGLLHGFGFAGALADIGLPEEQIALALLLFNLGIEAGQLAVIVCALGIYWPLRNHMERLANPIRALPVFTMGGIACYWTLDRLSLLFV